ncbi:MAG: cadherin-like domain-containing protein [Proteobacteria bacterium]|nr:cadherin-like domain-containing protein [Pseudomonadota bacterium]
MTPVNDGPVANADTLWVSNSTTVTLPVSVLLGNDTDIDGVAISITGFSAAAGQFTTNPSVNGDGTFSFRTTSDGGSTASPTVRTFTYTITDGAGGLHTGTVTVNVVSTLDGTGSANRDTINLSRVGPYQGAYIDGKGADDTLTSGTGGVVLIGGSGSDVLNGGSGNDILRGGAGNNDSMNGSAGIDLLDLSDATEVITFTLVQSATDTSYSLNSAGLGNNNTYKNMEGVIGTNFNDTLNGSSGNDVLMGGGGNDILVGGDGNDILIGGAGADTLTGGAGSDTLRFLKGDAASVDTITDYSATQNDKLDLSDLLDIGGGNVNDIVNVRQSGNNIIVSVDTNGTVGGVSFSDICILENYGFSFTAD